MNPTTQTGKETPEPMDALFCDVVRALGRERALGQISAQLREVVEAVQKTGKVGALKLELKISPNSRHEVVTVEVDYAVTQKMPKSGLPSSTFFVDEGGTLTRRDTRQVEFDLKPRLLAGAKPTTAGEVEQPAQAKA